MNTDITLRMDHPTFEPGRIQGFKLFWAFYVDGFNQKKQCQDCFKGKRSAQFNTLSARTGELYVMDERDSFKYLYVCGVGVGPKNLLYQKNFHLALRPQAGHSEIKETYNGYVVKVENAVEVPIPPLERCWKGLPEEHARCKNFQFGVEYFGWRDEVASGESE